MTRSLALGVRDLRSATAWRRHILSRVSWAIRRRYARTALGPIWPALTFLSYALVLAIVAAAFFGGALGEILPHLLFGMAIWLMLANVASEATSVFASNKPHLLGGMLPFSATLAVLVLSHTFFFALNLAVAAVVVALFGWRPDPGAAYVFLTIPILVIGAFVISLLVATACTLIKDLGPLANALIMVGIFVTPVWWRPQDLQRFEHLVDLNPLTHMLALVRQPLVEGRLEIETLLQAGGFLAIVAILGVGLFLAARKRLPYEL